MKPTTANFFWPHPWALGDGQKVKYHLISILQSQFQGFLHQTLCVFSQMKDTKHIRRDFNSDAWVIPQGSDFGALGMPRGGGVKKYFFSNMVMWHIKSMGMRSRTKFK